MSNFKNVADVMNAFEVKVFAVKNNPGKFTVSYLNKTTNKRHFINLENQVNEDGTKKYYWECGREMSRQEGSVPQQQIQMA